MRSKQGLGESNLLWAVSQEARLREKMKIG